MNDQRRQQLVEQYEDIALSLLMDDYADEDGARLLQEFEAAAKNGDLPELPDELDEKCRKLIDESFEKRERSNLLTRIGSTVLKAAVYVFVLLGLSTAMVLSVEALRIPVLNFFVQYTDIYTSLSMEEPDTDVQVQLDDLERRLQSLISDEYILVARETDKEGYLGLYFQNASGNIIALVANPSVGTINIDTEDSNAIRMELNTYDAVFVEKDGFHIIWYNSDSQMIYDLFADGMEADCFWELAYALAE